MTDPKPTPEDDPAFNPDTVLFLGNGILRVPCWRQSTDDLVNLDESRSESSDAGPSWDAYMEELWELACTGDGGKGVLSLADFTKLSAPRQAEWFDKYYPNRHGLTVELNPEALAALRLRLLARQLHPHDPDGPKTLTNPLLWRIGRLVAAEAKARASKDVEARVEVITTNLDCSLEQNIGWALGMDDDSPAEITVMSGFRQASIWSLGGTEGTTRKVRLWKLHGCLRDLLCGTEKATWDAIARSLEESNDDRSRGLIPLFKADAGESAPKLPEPWTGIDSPDKEQAEYRGVFSQTEYFKNLEKMAQMAQMAPAAQERANREQANFDALRGIIKAKPLMLVGYGLVEEDVDIVYLLHSYKSAGGTAPRTTLTAERFWNQSQQARLEQMGITPWKFSVPQLGFSKEPQRLKAASRHEWRGGWLKPSGANGAALAKTDKKGQEEWRKALQRAVARAWLGPQREKLDKLLQKLPSGELLPSGASNRSADGEQHAARLVIAGLGSIWHAFSLQKDSDFPSRRRVSAGLTSVDAQVPGGSGLVPCMEAAVMAGPDAVGRLAFLSNVPRGWKGWEEIEEFCLSAGVDVRPLADEVIKKGDEFNAGRTSYVLLWDTENEEVNSMRPKQRFIMDVQSLADEQKANQVAAGKPLACMPAEFLEKNANDLLFADKETDGDQFKSWAGPKIYETGASGDELATKPGLKPTIWTSGVGSLLRTAVNIAGCQLQKGSFPKNIEGVLKALDWSDEIKALTACDGLDTIAGIKAIGVGESSAALRRRYVAKLVSFEQPPWYEDWRDEKDEGVAKGAAREELTGFTYAAEVAYGLWLQHGWNRHGDRLLEMLHGRGEKPSGKDLLGEPDKHIGGGILTTIHEGGLMAAWERGREQEGSWKRRFIRVRAVRSQTGDCGFSHTITCESWDSPGSSEWREVSVAKIVIVKVEKSVEKSIYKMRVEAQVKPKADQKGGETKWIEQVLDLGTDARWNTLAAGDTVRGAMAFGLWALKNAASKQEAEEKTSAEKKAPAILTPGGIDHVLFASTVLATMKCYAGSFVDFLRMLEELRPGAIWAPLWGVAASASRLQSPLRD